MDRIDEIDKEIIHLKTEIKRLEKEQEQLSNMGPEEELAVLLHSKFCRHNHTDGCGWFYEIDDGIHNWERNAHREYLEKARSLFQKTGLDLPTLALVIRSL